MHLEGAPRFFMLGLTITTLAVLLCMSVSVSSRATTRSLNVSQVIHDKVDCNNKRQILDECSLQQGFSFKHEGFYYPNDHATLLEECKIQADALKCLKLYSKCQLPLTKQIMLALVNTRVKYNKKLCTEKPTEFSQKFIEMNQCMTKTGLNRDKGLQAEYFSVSEPESIAAANMPQLSDRIKYACCGVAQVKKNFVDSTKPQCAQHSRSMADLIDSYLTETVGIICPSSESSMKDCDKLPRVPQVKKITSKYFVLPMLDVIDRLAN